MKYIFHFENLTNNYFYQHLNTSSFNRNSQNAYLSPATPSTTKLSLVKVPVLSKQQTSTFPANGILKGSVQYTPEGSVKKTLLCKMNKLKVCVCVVLLMWILLKYGKCTVNKQCNGFWESFFNFIFPCCLEVDKR